MFKYIIYGAGAVGSAIGGSLAKTGFDVIMVGRKPHTEAINRQNGLWMQTLNGTELQQINAVDTISKIEISDKHIVFVTTKANDTEAALKELSVNSSIPIVCWQNGVENESTVSRYFKQVYGGVVRFTATMMEPGKVAFAGSGKLIIGKYPAGTDDITYGIASDLSRTEFKTLVSNRIMQDKWLKLLVNLISCVKPITKKTKNEQGQRLKICREILIEGMNVLEKAGIKALSSNNTEDSPEEMLKNFDKTLKLAEGIGQKMELQNSTWQSLAKHKKNLENEFYTGTIINMGEKYGIPTPYNKAILFFVRYISEKELGPESIETERIIKKIEEFS